jgi:hypothetical protein
MADEQGKSCLSYSSSAEMFTWLIEKGVWANLDNRDALHNLIPILEKINSRSLYSFHYKKLIPGLLEKCSLQDLIALSPFSKEGLFTLIIGIGDKAIQEQFEKLWQEALINDSSACSSFVISLLKRFGTKEEWKWFVSLIKNKKITKEDIEKILLNPEVFNCHYKKYTEFFLSDIEWQPSEALQKIEGSSLR